MTKPSALKISSSLAFIAQWVNGVNYVRERLQDEPADETTADRPDHRAARGGAAGTPTPSAAPMNNRSVLPHRKDQHSGGAFP